MHPLTKRFALAAWVGLLVLTGCGGGASTFRISGTITGATGVTVQLTGSVNRSTTTDGNGDYAFDSLANGSYTLTPSMAGYRFSPPSIAVTVNGGHVTGQSFTAIPAVTSSISGMVSGAIADGVLITLSGTTSGTTTTAGGGLYSFSGLPNGSYTLTPSKADHSFSPPSIIVTVNGANVTDRNFVSTSTTACSADSWASVSSGTSNWLFGVWGSGANDVWAVGDGGTILHWNGSAWSSVSSGTTDALHSVWGTGASDVWAVGDGGTTLHWNGSAWSNVSSGTTNVLYSAWGSGASDVWAVGDGGTTLHWNGSAWSNVSSGTTAWLYGVWGTGANDVWAVGDGGDGWDYSSGLILHWSGSAWSSVPSSTTHALFSVWGSGASDVWAVGDGGTILHWNGSAWSCVSSGTTAWLFSAWGSGANDVRAVGGSGTILERHPPPATPPPPTSQLDATVLRLYASAPVHAFLASVPFIEALYWNRLWTSGPCEWGGAMEVLLDGSATAPGTMLAPGSHALAVTYAHCHVYGGGMEPETILNGSASATYTTADLSDLPALVSLNSVQATGDGVSGRSDLKNVTADGSGTWTRLRTGTWDTTIYAPTSGSTLTNNATSNVAKFEGGTYTETWEPPPPGFAAGRGETFDNLVVAVGGVSYTLDGRLHGVYGLGLEGNQTEIHTGEVRITSNGMQVARIYGDMNGALRTEVLSALAPF